MKMMILPNNRTNHTELAEYQDEQPYFSNCNGRYDCDLENYAAFYRAHIHAYFSMFICIFGTFTNFLNIIILTRKDMTTMPVNRILTALAIADILKMIEYLPFAYYYYIDEPGKLDYHKSWAIYMLFHTQFSQVMHIISICLTLTLAIWRYILIGYPERNHILCSDRRCKIAIYLCYILSPLICIPTYFAFEINISLIIDDNYWDLRYHVQLSDVIVSNETYLLYYFWTYSVLIKLLPCVIMTVISCWLIRKLYKAKKRKQVLRNYIECFNTKNVRKAERRADRTTKMLVAVLLLFSLTEFPQGIFGLFIAIKGKCLLHLCYQKFGEIMDILALLSGSINFILYCSMNRMFRMTFRQLFTRKTRILLTKITEPPLTSEVHTTYV